MNKSYYFYVNLHVISHPQCTAVKRTIKHQYPDNSRALAIEQYTLFSFCDVT